MKQQLILLLTLLITSFLYAETDSLTVDSTKQVTEQRDTVSYSGDIVEYSAADSVLYLYGNAELESEGVRLTADTIKYYANSKTLDAAGHPILYSDGNTVSGVSMKYYMKERRGKVDYGSARTEGKLYNGNLIAKMADASYLVKSGDYSTCNQDTNPHFYFWGEKMKILPGDKAVVKPFVMNIADVPVAIFPYFIVPINKGRRSGFLTPHWGQITDQGSQGGYIDNIGYYWALSDYADLEASASFTNGEGFFFQNVRMNSTLNYALRYIMNGSLNANYDLMQNSEGTGNSWGLRYNHNQNIEPDGSFTLRGSGDLAGDRNFYKRSTDRRTDYLKRQLNSDLNLNKSFKEYGVSINASARYTQNLETGENSKVLPSISLSSSTRAFPFLGIDPDSAVSSDSLPWYRKLTWSYSGNMTNRADYSRKRTYNFQDPNYDTSNAVLTKSGGIDANHSISFGLPRFPKLGPVNVIPSIGFGSSWYFRSRKQGDTLRVDTIKYQNRIAFDTIYKWDTTNTFRHVEDYNIGTTFN
ncbi:MAG: LPS-assembly protein LptD, partial [Fibrobacteres bacterium]|nr:LPS-assembly protein LptD [Fibrobacterota bacterium]